MDVFLLDAMLDPLFKDSPYFLLVPAALASAISIIALSFMAGEFFSMPSLKSFAKLELNELGVSIIIVVIALALATRGGAFDIIADGFRITNMPAGSVCEEWELAHPNAPKAFAQADYFLGCRPKFAIFQGGIIPSLDQKGVLMKKLSLGYVSLMGNEIFIGLLSGLTTNFIIPLKIVKVDLHLMPYVSLGPINETHTLLMDTLAMTWAAVAAQKVLLAFIEISMISTFLPFGLLLRAFPFSRKTGSTIIAVVFAAYFAYPVSILINQHVYEMIANPQKTSPTDTRLEAGEECYEDSECLTGNCRGGSLAIGVNPAVAGKCMSPLTDFQEYESVFSVCKNEYKDEYYSYINSQYLQPMAEHQESLLDRVYYQSPTEVIEGTNNDQRYNSALQEMARKKNILGGMFNAMLTSVTPASVVNKMFRVLDLLVAETMQFFMLVVLFLVTEIIISVTLLKDFALLIGGEPRVFGLTKLV